MTHTTTRYPHDTQILGPTAQKPRRTPGLAAAELFDAATKAAEAEGRRVERKRTRPLLSALMAICTAQFIWIVFREVVR